MGIEGVACVTVVVETLMHQDRGALPTSLWFLVDQRVLVGVLRGHTLAGIKLALLRQRAFGLLCRRTLEQRANLMVGPMILGRCGLWKTMDQGQSSGDVLACLWRSEGGLHRLR